MNKTISYDAHTGHFWTAPPPNFSTAPRLPPGWCYVRDRKGTLQGKGTKKEGFTRLWVAPFTDLTIKQAAAIIIRDTPLTVKEAMG